MKINLFIVYVFILLLNNTLTITNNPNNNKFRHFNKTKRWISRHSALGNYIVKKYVADITEHKEFLNDISHICLKSYKSLSSFAEKGNSQVVLRLIVKNMQSSFVTLLNYAQSNTNNKQISKELKKEIFQFLSYYYNIYKQFINIKKNQIYKIPNIEDLNRLIACAYKSLKKLFNNDEINEFYKDTFYTINNKIN